MSLRSYVEILLKQVVEDISNQFHRTNEQFRNRMEEMRYTKIKLEGLHCGTANQVRTLSRQQSCSYVFQFLRKLRLIATAVIAIAFMVSRS